MKRNFWNTCPRKLGHFPDTTCPLGQQSEGNKGDEPNSCSWSINSEEDKYCFWKWVRRNSDSSGEMDVLSQSDINKLVRTSDMKINQILKETLEKLEKDSEFQELKELNEDS